MRGVSRCANPPRSSATTARARGPPPPAGRRSVKDPRKWSCTETLVASRLPFASRMSPRLAVCHASAAFFCSAMLRQFVVPPDLQIHQPETQPGEGKHHQRQQGQHAFELLFPFDHPKTASRPWRSVPQPTASRAAAKIVMVYCGVASGRPRGELARCSLVVRQGRRRFRQPDNLPAAARDTSPRLRPRAGRASPANANSQAGRPAFDCSAASLRQARFPFAHLFAQLVDLAFLPDITHRRTGDEQAQKQRLQRRAEPDCRRLIFSILCHLKFFPTPATARCGCADFPPIPPRPARSPCAKPISFPARAAAATPAHPPRR